MDGDGNKSASLVLIIALSVVCGTLLIVILVFIFLYIRHRRKKSSKERNNENIDNGKTGQNSESKGPESYDEVYDTITEHDIREPGYQSLAGNTEAYDGYEVPKNSTFSTLSNSPTQPQYMELLKTAPNQPYENIRPDNTTGNGLYTDLVNVNK